MLRRKTFFSRREKRIEQMIGKKDLFMGKSSDLLKISLKLHVCKQMETLVFVLIYKREYQKMDHNYLYFLFHFLSVPNIFMIAYIQEHNLLSECAFGPFTYVCPGNCISFFSVFLFLNLNLNLFCLDRCRIEIVCSALHLYH